MYYLYNKLWFFLKFHIKCIKRHYIYEINFSKYIIIYKIKIIIL